MFRPWVNLLCLANRNQDRGTLPPIADIAFGLRLSEGKATSVLKDLVAAELLDRNEDGTFQPHGWRARQRVSDNVADRVARHRSKTVSETDDETQTKRPRNVTGNVTETFPHVRATDTETESEAELTANAPDDQTGQDATSSGAAAPPEPADPPPAGGAVLPDRGAAQQIVKAFCTAVGIERPVSYGKAAGQARQLAAAGITAEQIPDIVAWLREQDWVGGAIDLGLIVNQADKWQAARVDPGTGRRRAWNDPRNPDALVY
jgi:hypothetical protein